MKRIAIALTVAVCATVAPAARADHEIGHGRPQKTAAEGFADAFEASAAALLGYPLKDHEWGFALGGFGGDPTKTRVHVPVIFVHGNNVDAADWYPVRDDFRAAGWNDQELWGLSYNGLGGSQGSALLRGNPERDAEHREKGEDFNPHVTSNEINVEDLYDFIRAVRHYTGSAKFSIVAHSLGVTIARRTLKKYPLLRPDLVAFVGIAGGNHGTSFCPPGTQGVVVSCNEIAADTDWLRALNGPGGSDETYGATDWLTIYDCTGIGDPAFAGPLYAHSPTLLGADNRCKPLTYHNDLRLNPDIVAEYRRFLEDAEPPA